MGWCVSGWQGVWFPSPPQTLAHCAHCAHSAHVSTCCSRPAKSKTSSSQVSGWLCRCNLNFDTARGGGSAARASACCHACRSSTPAAARGGARRGGAAACGFCCCGGKQAGPGTALSAPGPVPSGSLAAGTGWAALFPGAGRSSTRPVNAAARSAAHRSCSRCAAAPPLCAAVSAVTSDLAAALRVPPSKNPRFRPEAAGCGGARGRIPPAATPLSSRSSRSSIRAIRDSKSSSSSASLLA
jgi:hypothetical protein